MTAEPREELISAYLDGELAESERAEVEKLLAENSALRRLHDELAALRSGMQSLARHKLDHDLGPAVLRRAEQTVLRGAEAKPAPATSVPGETAAWWNRGGSWRRIVWPAAAVAAALAILIYDANQRPAERQVAQSAPEREPPVGALRESAMPREEAAGVEAKRAESEEFDRPDSLQLRSRALGDEQMPAASAPAPAAARPSAPPGDVAGGGERAAFGALYAKEHGPNGVVLEVTPEYLAAKTFEKLLDAKKIKWRRLEADASRAAAGYYRQSDKRSPRALEPAALHAGYILEIDRGQVDKLLADLETRDGRLKVEKKQPRRFAEAREALAETEAGEVKVILVAPRAAAPSPARKQP